MPEIPILSGDVQVSRFREAMRADRFPTQCQWEITCRCNFKCVMCYTDCFNTPEWVREELPLAEILRIMDEMREEGVLELVLTGGEPMARPDFREIYTHAVQSGFLVTVFTNGSYINEDWIRIWKQQPPNMIEISHHAAMESTFDQVTAMPGSFRRVRKSIQLILEACLPLTLKATGLTINQEEVHEIKKYARSLGTSVGFRFGPEVRVLANGDPDPLKYQIPVDKLQMIIDQDEEFKSSAKQKESEELKRPSFCPESRGKCHIDAYGRMQLCSGNRWNSFDLRRGSFHEGFYHYLPQFYCARKKGASAELIQINPYETTHV